MKKSLMGSVLAVLTSLSLSAEANPQLLAIGSLAGIHDLSGLTGTLENGVDSADVLGGVGSGLAYAGHNQFLALPDRGPNAATWNAELDNTTSYIARVHTLTMKLTDQPSAGLPMTLTPRLDDTALLFSLSPLFYGDQVPALNKHQRHYFSGRSDNFGAGVSTDPRNGRLDPEGIRVGHNGKIYISDEYGPYLYEFNRHTGNRTRIFKLPAAFNAEHLSAKGDEEITDNDKGRVANKGMEGLAITPDGKWLVGFEQSPLIQDGGDGGRANRIIAVDLHAGKTRQYVYDNYLANKDKSYNSSEILAINNHEFLVLERDGKGLGDDSQASVKRIFKINLKHATDIGPLNISGEASLLPYAVEKTLFLDLKTLLNDYGIASSDIPAKLEGMAFGDDVISKGVTYHTLWIANDNDFLPTVAGPNKFFVFGFTDQDLTALGVEGGLVQPNYDPMKPMRPWSFRRRLSILQ
jgi:outer membrane protein assembly factor BamB